VPLKYSSLSPKSNGGVGSKRSQCTVPGDAGTDSRCSTPVSTTSSAGGSQRPSAAKSARPAKSCKVSTVNDFAINNFSVRQATPEICLLNKQQNWVAELVCTVTFWLLKLEILADWFDDLRTFMSPS